MNDRKHRRPERDLAPNLSSRADSVVVQRRAQSEPRVPVQASGGLTSDPNWAWSFTSAINAGVDYQPIQFDGDPSGLDAATIHDHAARGVSGSSMTMPHLEQIQDSFGAEHDVSGIRAHIGGAAADAAARIAAACGPRRGSKVAGSTKVGVATTFGSPGW